MILKKLIYILLILLCGCATTGRVNIQEDAMFITRKLMGQYIEYRYVDPGWRYPPTCWIKTSFDSFMGKIPVATKKVKYEPGEMLYLRRVYFSMPGSAGGFWHYHLESNQSKHTYPIRGDKGSTSMHNNVFNISENDTEL